MSAPIVILSGPPGSGKTTIARELVATAPGKVVNIEGDAFWFFFRQGPNSGPRTGPTPSSTAIIVKAMMAAARPYAEAGYETIVDFSLGPWFLPLVLTPGAGPPVDFVVVLPSLEVCARRAAGRQEGRMPDYAPYRDFHEAFQNLGPLAGHAIRDDEASAGDIATRIRQGLATGAFRLES